MPEFNLSKLSLTPAELTLLLQRAEPQALVAITEARQRNKGLSNPELVRVLERNFVTKPRPEEEFLENAAAYVCSVAKLYEQEINAQGGSQELLGAVLNLAKQIDRAEDTLGAGARKLSQAIAGGIPAVSASVGKLLPADVTRVLEAYTRNPEEPAAKAAQTLSGGRGGGAGDAARAEVDVRHRPGAAEKVGCTRLRCHD